MSGLKANYLRVVPNHTDSAEAFRNRASWLCGRNSGSLETSVTSWVSMSVIPFTLCLGLSRLFFNLSGWSR